ncbi:MAG: M48 family metalloprotease [Tepidisphaeraceae bacterium]
MLTLKYGRGDELESDAWGLDTMVAAGFDPSQMLAVMQTLKEASGSNSGPSIFSTHPDPDARIEKIKAYLNEKYPNGVPSNLTGGTATSASVGATPASPAIFLHFQQLHRLPAGKAVVQFVPVVNGLFAELPAEANIPPFVPADEIDQADAVVLQVAADGFELFDQIAQAIDNAFQVALDCVPLVRRQTVFEPHVQPRCLFMRPDNIGNDPTNQREGSVGFVDRENFLPGTHADTTRPRFRNGHRCTSCTTVASLPLLCKGQPSSCGSTGQFKK